MLIMFTNETRSMRRQQPAMQCPRPSPTEHEPRVCQTRVAVACHRLMHVMVRPRAESNLESP